MIRGDRFQAILAMIKQAKSMEDIIAIEEAVLAEGVSYADNKTLQEVITQTLAGW